MKNLLFPHRFQKPALVAILLFGGLLCAVLFGDVEFPFLKMKVPYEDPLAFSNNNLTDEITFIGFLLSLTVYGFAREKDEDEFSVNMRFGALVIAVLLHTVISLLLILFLYGLGFLFWGMMHLFTVLILYVVIYKTRRFISRSRLSRP